MHQPSANSQRSKNALFEIPALPTLGQYPLQDWGLHLSAEANGNNIQMAFVHLA